jgi:hypothetical protein
MQLIASSHPGRAPRGPVIASTFVGGFLLFGGLVLTWLALATPFVGALTPSVIRPTIDQMAVGAVIWAVALIAPPSFAIVGAIRLWLVATAVLRKPGATPVGRQLASLGEDCVVAPVAMLPDGRRVRNVVVGPFGLAIVSEPPSAKAVRRHGTAWEMRRRDGRWVPLEAPIDRASRDAERVRRWIASEERDFVVKVYVALVTSDPSVTRTPTCAVVTADSVAAWIASLPPQRSLNESRRRDLTERVRLIT